MGVTAIEVDASGGCRTLDYLHRLHAVDRWSWRYWACCGGVPPVNRKHTIRA